MKSGFLWKNKFWLNNMNKFAAKILIFSIFLLWPTWVMADSFLPLYIGGVDPGITTMPVTTGIINNPAVIGKIENTRFSMYFSPVFQFLDVNRATISSVTGLPSPGGDLVFDEVGYSNNIYDYFVGMTTDFGYDRITLGLAIYSPFRQEFKQLPSPLRYHLSDRNFFNLFITPVVSMKLHRKFYFGFGLSYIYSRFRLGLVRDRYLRADLPESAEERFEAKGIANEKITVDSSDNNFGFSFGFYYLPKKWLEFGGTYRSKIRSLDSASVETHGKGYITRYFDGEGYKTLEGNSKMETTFPDIISLGAKIKLSRNWWGDFTLSWIRWSSHQKLQVLLTGSDFTNVALRNWDLNISSYRGFQDVLTPQFTFMYKPHKGFNFNTAIRYLPPATPEKWVNPAAVDNHSLTLQFTASFEVFEFVNLKVGYGIDWMIPLNVENSGYDPNLARICIENHIDVVWCSECQDTYQGKAVSSGNGNYKRITHQVGIGVDFNF